MTDAETIAHIEKTYKDEKKAVLVTHIDWLLEYAQTMELPLNPKNRLVESLERKIKSLELRHEEYVRADIEMEHSDDIFTEEIEEIIDRLLHPKIRAHASHRVMLQRTIKAMKACAHEILEIL